MDDAHLDAALEEMHHFMCCESKTIGSRVADEDCSPKGISRAMNRTLTYAYAYRFALEERTARTKRQASRTTVAPQE